jgi:hypothetical protein
VIHLDTAVVVPLDTAGGILLSGCHSEPKMK